MDNETCSTCIYFVKRDAYKGGICRRYPDVMTKYPTEWCGEHISHEDWEAWEAKTRKQEKKDE
jgi:hypothetical protein